MYTSISQCRKGNRCRQFRECASCAKIRQAKIADIAEDGSLQSPYLTYAVVKPLQDKTFTDEKAKIMKAIKKHADGGLWTIETGIQSGLHTNLVIGSSKPFDMNILYEAVTVESSIWGNTALSHKEVRNVASYSAKQKGMPSKDSYHGNLYGRFGTFKTPLVICAEQTISPVMAGLALERMLAEKGIQEPKRIYLGTPEKRETPKEIRKRFEKNKEEKEKYCVQMANKKAHENSFKNMQRMLAVVAGEIELKGTAYLKGYGIVDKQDLRKFGIADTIE
jgi:hypothetical protein